MHRERFCHVQLVLRNLSKCPPVEYEDCRCSDGPRQDHVQWNIVTALESTKDVQDKQVESVQIASRNDLDQQLMMRFGIKIM